MKQLPNNVQNKLRSHNLRVTRARQLIIQSLLESATAISLSELATKTRVDQSTIYRNLPALQKAGVVEAISLPSHETKYALLHQHHDHAVCTTCGFIEAVSCPSPTKVPTSHFANLTGHEVLYYGICQNCARS